MKHTLVSTIFFLVVGLSLSAISSGVGDHGQFIYTGFTGSNLTLDGAAKITETGLVGLTNESFRIKGHAFHPAPVRFRQSPNGTVPSFSVSFVFGILSSFGDERGHGMAFFIAPSDDFSTAFSLQFLGLLNDTNNGISSNHLFAIELDTIENDEFGDINNNHVGIDINSLNSVQSNYAGFYDNNNGTFTNVSLINGDAPMQVWVDYDGNATLISVTLAPLGIERPRRPLLSAIHDLSTVLTDQAYLGFSSSTGLSTGHHYVLGWSFGLNGPAPFINSTKLPKLPYLGPRPQSKVLEIVLPIASAMFVLAIGVAAVVLVRRHFRRKGELLLVYEYMTNGSLDKYLYHQECRPTLDWGQRFQIVKDIASGLLYLHEEWDRVVIHRDVKANNVLLDKQMNGRLGDFGLARLFGEDGEAEGLPRVVAPPPTVSAADRVVAADRESLPPRTDSTECRSPSDSQGNQLVLVDWVLQNWHKESLLDTVDAKIGGHYDVGEACLALKLGLMCSHPFPDARPSMRQVMQYLDGDVLLPELQPAHFSFHVLALTQKQNGGYDSSTMCSYPSPMMATFGSTSSFSLDGR
ncbi:hypothetical protein GUJ93_ZPchr0007g3168 [Zizania palustris]|uniref:non-specific serine/threonine protein kinase n=1 Tax=Zizania palustris TaxID=103762 RepID=A0A8J5W6M4_ZIZPA|nr:hypothetical protein GUJ93_ZPchr0007g3168 [Zizania palustris]